MSPVNIHTHHADASADPAILNLYRDFERAGQEKACSIGLHPWYLERDTLEQEWAQVAALADLPQVYAIGECGLDRLAAADMDWQEDIFTRHIQLAQRVGKPLIVHCVRAFDELLRLLRRQESLPPVIVHGFNRKWTVAQPLLEAGCYLSFGAALLQNSIAQEVFRQVPEDRCFLETDDALLPVTDLYRAAAALKNIPEAQVFSAVANSFAAVFNRL